MKKPLELFLRFSPANESEITFRNKKGQFRIYNLINSLKFIGDMKQLSKAIDADGKQNCIYKLANSIGMEWNLSCTLKEGIVALEIWLHELRLQETIRKVFLWRGMPCDFRETIDLMIENAGRYKYFARS